MVDFVLVLLLLLPLFFGLLQLGLVLHVRNTLTAAASEGARYGAAYDRSPAAGAARTRDQIRGALAGKYAREVSARLEAVGGAPTVVVRARAEVPTLGFLGPSVSLEAEGHATREVFP